MAIDRDSTRAAKARRRAQRLARRATGRPMRGPNVLTHVPSQPSGTELSAAKTAGHADDTDEDTSPPLGTWGAPELPEDFITADALAGHGSEAERLQEDLAGVRQMLDRPLPPVQRRPRRRIGPGFWMSLVLLIFIVGAVLAVLVVIGMSPFGKPSDSPASSTAPASTGPVDSAAANSAPGGTAPGGTVPAVGGQVAGLPTAGPGVDQRGAALGVQVLADQSVLVTEQAVLAAPGLGSFNLTLPEPTSLSGEAKKLHPAVDDLKITINSSPATATQTDERNWTVVSPVGGARTVLLKYRLRNAVFISQPSSAGRALALVTPLLAELLHDGNQPVNLLIPADGIDNVNCVGAPYAESVCGAHRGPNWLVTIPDDATSAAVTLQLTLR